jgi:hypothetical protein
VFDVVLLGVGFEVRVSVGCGVALWLRDECVWPSPGVDRHF